MRGRVILQAGIAAAAVALLTPGPALAVTGFTDGVTAGEITAHSAIVWAQTKGTGKVRAEVATDRRFRHVVARKNVKAARTNDNTVQTTINGLDPGRTYHYRFCVPGKPRCSPKGAFETAPAPSANQTIRFAYSGDETGVSEPGQNAPFWGDFKTFKTMAGEHNDFNIDFGDTIYSDPEVPGWADTPALTVPEKWAMYRKKLALKNMRTIRASTGIYNHWDDHEFINDFSLPENGQTIYDNGVQAFRDYEPVHYSDSSGIYRTFRWGKNLQIFFLDERSFRSAKASANHVCDNPDTGEPDLAPTAPQSVRDAFGLLIPSLSQPVSQECKDAINDPNRTMLGQAQLQTFLNDVQSSTAKWKVVMNEVPIQQFYALPYDRWEGYAYERVALLNALQQANVDHLVFLTTDDHAAFANVIRYRTLSDDVAPSNAPAGDPPIDSPYHDFTIGPVATKSFWQETDDATGGSGYGKLVSNAFYKPSPPNGVGMACAQGATNSYAEVTVKGGSLKIEYKDENGDPVIDSDDTTPCGPYVLTH
jgi:alkaline phosphatase D